MKTYFMEQGTPSWYEKRSGIPTASRFGKIITAAKGALSASSKAYAAELVAERLGHVTDSIQTQAMSDGIEREAEARLLSELAFDATIDEVGLITTDDGRLSCSPDGIMYLDEPCGIEIKCPLAKTHIMYCEAGGLPDTYKQQVHGSMAVTGFDKWWFVSYAPGFRLHTYLVERDEYTDAVYQSIQDFANQIDQMELRYVDQEAA